MARLLKTFLTLSLVFSASWAQARTSSFGGGGRFGPGSDTYPRPSGRSGPDWDYGRASHGGGHGGGRGG